MSQTVNLMSFRPLHLKVMEKAACFQYDLTGPPRPHYSLVEWMGTGIRLRVEGSLKTKAAVQGCGVGWRHEGAQGQVEQEASSLPPPASSPAGSAEGCWPAGLSDEGWVQRGPGSFAVCPGTGPAPAASAGGTVAPAQDHHSHLAYASPHAPACTWSERKRNTVRHTAHYNRSIKTYSI